jgi:hypothetical protein
LPLETWSPQPASFSRESIETPQQVDLPLQNQRELMKESERVSRVIEQEERKLEDPGRSAEGFSRDEVLRVRTGSSIADVFEAPMRKGLFGVTRMDTFPFKIMINGRVVEPRQLISLVHEMLHVWAKLHKVEELPHDKLHDLAVFIYSEIVPVVEKYKNRRS